MAIRVLINGVTGKMGQVALAALEKTSDFDVVAGLSRTDNLTEKLDFYKPDLALDLTSAAVVYGNTQAIINAKVRPVIGTSGLHTSQIQTLQQLCEAKNLGGIIVPNFSMGAVLLMQFAQQAAMYFSHVEIVETHHEHKHDAPSGTALRTAEMISEAQPEIATINTPKVLEGARGCEVNRIRIHSLRLPGFVAEEQVVFGAAGESLNLRHTTINHECFIPGIIRACKAAMTLPRLVVGLENLLEKTRFGIFAPNNG